MAVSTGGENPKFEISTAFPLGGPPTVLAEKKGKSITLKGPNMRVNKYKRKPTRPKKRLELSLAQLVLHDVLVRARKASEKLAVESTTAVRQLSGQCWTRFVARKKRRISRVSVAPGSSSPGFVFMHPGQDARWVAPGTNHPHRRTARSLGYCHALYSHPPAISWRGCLKKAKTRLTNNGGAIVWGWRGGARASQHHYISSLLRLQMPEYRCTYIGVNTKHANI